MLRIIVAVYFFYAGLFFFMFWVSDRGKPAEEEAKGLRVDLKSARADADAKGKEAKDAEGRVAQMEEEVEGLKMQIQFLEDKGDSDEEDEDPLAGDIDAILAAEEAGEEKGNERDDEEKEQKKNKEEAKQSSRQVSQLK